MPPGRLTTTFQALPAVPVDGVSIGVHQLTKDAELFASITRRLGKRLSYQLRCTEEAHTVPGPGWLDAFRYYQAATLGVLREQRERYQLIKGENVSEEQLKAQFRDELHKALATFSPEERAFAMQLWGAGAAIATTGTETPQ